MFKHLLIPTDGSELSKEAVRSGIRLAHELGAKVTALYVMPDYNALTYGAEALLTINAAEFDAHVQKYADKALHFVEHLAREQTSPAPRSARLAPPSTALLSSRPRTWIAT